ncbi:barstar family protein [Erwinia pyri]|uniref:Barstar family protein n=1 Tax=Erwinia pyri TaxID=3062598 RepID=A0AA50HNJ6_9GAMM|nr:barstar family protein [Erwinia sp. DE2]WLS76928.1 barstar family protein [Erwinia sp. DE2]
MKSISFDFAGIGGVEDFYRQFCRKFAIDIDFGNNLDALWDALTGMIELPSRVTFRHLATHPDAAQFKGIIAVMREAEEASAGKFSLRIC